MWTPGTNIKNIKKSADREEGPMINKKMFPPPSTAVEWPNIYKISIQIFQTCT